MLNTKDAVATIAVKDLKIARAFYEGTLELPVADADEQGALTLTSGRSRILVYESQFAGTNQATTATWIVGDDLDRIVQTLKAKQVAFEHYDMPDTTRQGDIHVAGGVRVAWLKDPDGNIISLVNQ